MPTESAASRPLIPEEIRAAIAAQFSALSRPVRLTCLTVKDSSDVFSEFTRKLCVELGGISPGVTAEIRAVSRAEAKEVLCPAVELSPAGASGPPLVRFTGAPAGEEGKALLQSVLLLGTGAHELSPASLALLKTLNEPRHVRVFSSPSCPYCPGQVIQIVRCALARPDLVRVECVNVDEFPDLAALYKVGSVPHTVFGEDCFLIGLAPENIVVPALTELKVPEEASMPQAARAEEGVVNETDLLILGAGPAGLSAAIYAARAGLDVAVLEKSIVGGQVAQTALVENYPGFARISGLQLVESLVAHARQYAYVREGVDVLEIKLGRKVEVYTPESVYRAKALIFATGAAWLPLGVPGEKELFGRGVTHCAHCDGHLYKGRKAVVVGGGNSAATDALQLKNLGVDVAIVHRRDNFRAEKALADSVANQGIPVYWNTEVVRIAGRDKVASVHLRNSRTGEERDMAVDAVFVAVGLSPNSEQAAELGVTLAPDKSIVVDAHMRTNIPRIYAAGDVTGGVRQIVTASGSGAAAAIAVAEDLQRAGA